MGLFEEFEVPRTLLPALPGEPVVLGLAEHWDELEPQTLEALQAELEPLGVSLLLISSRELLCVRPGARGNGVVRSSRMRQLWPSGLGPWHRAPAVNAVSAPGCASTRRALLTLALVDEQGLVRWLQRSMQSAQTLDLLHAALAQAGGALHEQRRWASGSRISTAPARAELTACLSAALTATLGAGDDVQARAAGGAGRSQRIEGARR